MAKFKVTPEMMVTTSKTVDSKIEEWNTAVKALYQYVQELDSMFDGKANDTLNTRMVDDQPKFTELANLMTQYSQAIVKAAQTYTTGDQNAANAIRTQR